jgi:hypothetical protein
VNDLSDVVTTFQERRRKLFTYGIYPIIGIVAGFTVAYFTAEPQGTWTGWAGLGFAAAFIAIVALVLLVFVVYRCPVCNKVPMDYAPDGEKGVTLNPDCCPTCGTRLK